MMKKDIRVNVYSGKKTAELMSKLSGSVGH